MSVKFYNSIEQAVSDIINKIDGDIRLGSPLGLGKPNTFINTMYERMTNTPQRCLHIFSALSLVKPTATSDLEAPRTSSTTFYIFVYFLKYPETPNRVLVNGVVKCVTIMAKQL